MSPSNKRMHKPWRGHGLALGTDAAHFGRQLRVLCRATQVMRKR